MKTDLMKLIRWFCSKLTDNDLASAVPVLQEVLGGSRKDLELKPEEDRPPNYRQFRVDLLSPLTESPRPKEDVLDWHQIQQEHEQETGSRIKIVLRRKGMALPPEKCTCQHCGAPVRCLYLNNGKKASQVKCKISRR